jgi:hypothetical protein
LEKQRFVIASEAKQSRIAWQWGLLRFARNDTKGASGARAPSQIGDAPNEHNENRGRLVRARNARAAFLEAAGVFSLYFFLSIGNAHIGVRLYRPREGRRVHKNESFWRISAPPAPSSTQE